MNLSLENLKMNKRIVLYLLTLFSFYSCTDKKRNNSKDVIQKENIKTKQEVALFKKLDEDQSGFYFENQLIETAESNILNYEYLYNGSGVAVGDINNDGLPDIFMGGNFFGGRLFLNKGNLQFEQISEKAGVFFEGFTTGVSFVDINNDGYDDIYMCRSKSASPDERRNILLINNKDLTFTNRAKEYGIDDPGYCTNSIFFDYDNDNDLDLYVLNHRTDFKNAVIIPINGEALPYEKSDINYTSDKLYENKNGNFIDVTKKAGVTNNRFGLGVFAADINEDGWLDLYIANDFNDKDQVLINNHLGGFEDQIDNYLDHMSKNSMGCEVGDFNNDGLLDIVTLDMTPEDNYRQKQLSNSTTYDMYYLGIKRGLGHQILRNCLHLNEGNGYTEIGQSIGMSHTDWSWSPILADFDNDGLKDLFISNGYYRDVTDLDYVKHGSASVISSNGGLSSNWQMQMIANAKSTPIINYLFKNRGNLEFENISEQNWGDFPTFSNGCVYADLDLDGDLDLIWNNLDQPSAIYENKSESTKNNFIAFTSDASTCRVYLYQKGERQMVDLNPYRGYMSSHHAIAHFGLGHNPTVDSVVFIQNGKTPKVIVQPESNRYWHLTDSIGTSTSYPSRKQSSSILLKKSLSLMKPNEVVKTYNDFKHEPLLSRKNSSIGPTYCKGDLNGDGLEDLFITGESGVSGKLLFQTNTNNFNIKIDPTIETDKEYCDSDAAILDIDKDGDLDLYVVSGGYLFEEGDTMYQDRLYINDGLGNFKKKNLPKITANGSSIFISDFDGDQREDMLVLAGAKPNSYPMEDQSFVLFNSTDGLKITTNILPKNGLIGICNDIEKLSINKEDMFIIAREWDNLLALKWKDGRFIDVSKQIGIANTHGIWNDLYKVDIDKDGQLDLIAGNVGTNDFFKVAPDKVAHLIAGDFFGSKKIEAVQFFHYNDQQHSKHSLDQLFTSNPLFRRLFPKYQDYSTITMTDFLQKLPQKEFLKKKLQVKSSVWLHNSSNKLEAQTLPKMAQISEVHGALLKDVNRDNIDDLIIIGNNFDVDVKQGKIDAGGVQLFLSNGTLGEKFDSFTYYRISKGEYREIIEIGNQVLILDKDYKLWQLQ